MSELRGPLMVSVVTGLSCDAVVDRFGRAPTGLPARSWPRLLDDLARGRVAPAVGRALLAVAGLDDGSVLVWEPFSAEGVRPEVLGAVTAHGARMVAVCDNDRDTAIAWAADGTVTAALHRLAPGEITGTDPARARAVFAHAGLDPRRPDLAACLRAARDLTGIDLVAPGEHETLLIAEITPHPLPHTAARATPLPGAVAVVPSAEHHGAAPPVSGGAALVHLDARGETEQ
ncbi:DUF6461 domain-containing protein [Actinokineospora terrae]|uniref:Uncharacterized protein n=1 Tax=Actinokineospora terrae TaxID=155974 RepID=A0A1H9MBU9_9PSEU|nr:DUF6461 domain-containing protein [Actinokineospora terrae]SER20949.1 hypothetical protein SAMN04487818_10268 [Actinokineospora terrae]